VRAYRSSPGSIRSRLNRLERDLPHRDRCPVCRDRPGFVLRSFHQDSPDGTPVPYETEGDTGEACAGCGWAPNVTQIVEVVVTSREDIARWAESEASASRST
jgi:hypothetical protein